MRTITQAIIIATTILLIIYDVFAYFYGDSSTISERIWAWSSNYPFVPFLGGLLCGHLFFPAKLLKDDE